MSSDLGPRAAGVIDWIVNKILDLVEMVDQGISDLTDLTDDDD